MVTEMEDEEEKFDSSEEDDDIVDDVLTKNIVRESDSPAFKVGGYDGMARKQRARKVEGVTVVSTGQL